jgi:hypothetical protein
MGETAGKGSMTPSPRPSAVRVTARSFHSERQGLPTSAQGNENICAEVAVYSPLAFESPDVSSDHSDAVDSQARRDALLGAHGSKVTNGDLLAWL